MFDIWFIVSLLVFSALCFVEFFVFNEETLLALCFFSFIFFSFNSMGDTVVDIFQSRALKFESDLLLSFNLSKQSVMKSFSEYFLSRGFGSKLKILFITVSNHLSLSSKYSSFKFSRVFYLAGFSKLFELISFENKLFSSFHKKSVSLLLYPLIFQTTKTNVSFLANLSAIDRSHFSCVKTSVLKSIS
jgi:hypothetical protein